jgi:hypothetical protein
MSDDINIETRQFAYLFSLHSLVDFIFDFSLAF